MTPLAALLPGGRLHLQHGPIDLIIGADGARDLAFAAARDRFGSVLAELVDELPLLRTPLLPGAPCPQGTVARRMDTACRPFTSQFITRMAAVAGSVADEVLDAMIISASPDRAYVNNGGDISVFMSENQIFITAMQSHDGVDLGRITITQGQGIGGIATSGRHGRSHSLGIADSVTVLAGSAAKADVAATLIANAVDLPGHPGVTRLPANQMTPDSDLGAMPVVTDCTRLSRTEKAKALEAGVQRAQAMHTAGHIKGAALFLQGEARVLGHGITTRELSHEREHR
ncbi:MAG: UPF0280 family protein [Silicimonas sp.]|nr:UPF0280 family protein [Silicimonas sp.]